MGENPDTSTRSRILVVEDDTAIRQLITVTLEEDGYEVIAASDGLEAVARAAETYPDAAVLDVMMPHVDGYEVARRLRDHRALAGIPVIFVTARTLNEDVDRGYESGGDDYLMKPFSPDELRERIRALLMPRAA